MAPRFPATGRSNEKRPMKLRSSAFLHARAKKSELADAALHQTALDGKRCVEAADMLADGRVVGRPRLGGHAIVPDLADFGAAPLDHVEGGLSRADGCDGRQRDGGCSAKGSHSKHEVSPVGN